MSRATTAPTAKPVTTGSVQQTQQQQQQLPHDRVAKRAYEKWMKRGCPQGTEFQDWVEAEAELKAEVSRGGTAPAPNTRR
jgi:hypothetical protein